MGFVIGVCFDALVDDEDEPRVNLCGCTTW